MFVRLLSVVIASFLAISVDASQVSWGAADSNGIGGVNGTDLPVGNLVRVGSFNISDSQIVANKTDLAFLESHFIEFGRAAIGDGVGGIAAFWFKNTTASTDALAIAGARIYYFIYNAPAGSTPTQIGVFTAPNNGAWIFPDDNAIPNTTSTDLANVPHDSTGLIIGGFGVGTSDATGTPLYNLANLSGGGTPTPTATPTPTVTVTPTVTPTPTVSPSGSPTPTPSIPPTPSPIPTPSATPTASVVPTPSATPNPSITPTPNPSASPTPTVTGDALLNISTRARAQTGDNVLIGGFILGGDSATKQVVVRALGPSLGNQGVASPLLDPSLQLFDSSGHLLASNNDWMSNTNAQEISDVGLAPTDPRESAILTTLSPGNFTAVVTGSDSTTNNVALVEVYALDSTNPPELLNISTRASVGTDQDQMIAGLIVGGTTAEAVVVRGLGPSLSSSSITNPLPNPTLTIYNSSGIVIGQNDDWQNDPGATGVQAVGLAPTNPLESAILLTLPPGTYTAVLSDVNGATGVALVEVYNVTGHSGL
ncbi:MAG: DVUA0089 family protein [Chthoniobacterales bacterium]|nr:DVUA0089 family protein [Chthoniobacterales bacterium]